jgi:hypothetical protein
MKSEEDIWRALESLVSSLKCVEDELLEAGSLLRDDPLLEYHLLTLKDRVRIICLLSELSEWCRAISKVCLEIHSQIMLLQQIDLRQALRAA